MDEKTEEKVEAEKSSEGTQNPTGSEGTEKPEPKIDPKLEARRDLLNREEVNAERMEKANQEKTELLEREEKLEKDRETSGRGRMVPKKEKKPLTDIEYAEAYEKGEVDPFENNQNG